MTLRATARAAAQLRDALGDAFTVTPCWTRSGKNLSVSIQLPSGSAESVALVRPHQYVPVMVGAKVMVSPPTWDAAIAIATQRIPVDVADYADDLAAEVRILRAAVANVP